MNPRHKVLLGVLLGLVLLWQGGGAISDVVFKPIRERQARLRDLQDNHERKSVQRGEVLAALRDLKNWKARSLPPDSLIASTLYQHWLIELAAKTGITDVTVTPNRTVQQGETYHTIPLTVRARATISTLCDFLLEFQRRNLLHKVARMTLESRRSERGALEVTLEVEGLSLNGTPQRTTLFLPGQEQAVAVEFQNRKRSEFNRLSEKNIFEKYRPAEKPPDPPQVAKAAAPLPADKFDAAEHVYLIGRIDGPRGPEAWLYDRAENARQIVHVNDSFDVAGLKGRVLAIEPDSILLEVAGQKWHLDYGRNLRQLRGSSPSLE